MAGAGAVNPRSGPPWDDNWTRGTGLRMEIMDTATSDVWICQVEVDKDAARALVLPEGFRLSGVAAVMADEAWFDRSPDATEDGPVDTIDVDGLTFARVARPMRFDPVGPITVMTIDKHHTMRYRAGRTIELIDRGDGTLLTPAWASGRDVDRELPDGWSIIAVTLTSDLVTHIPHPATVAVLGDGSGFHGPLPRAVLDEATR
ncbi:MAG: hypothetical protein ACR2QE_19650 [Acidimicrobiales bacterium]